MRDNLRAKKKINETTQHDLKLNWTSAAKKRIERVLAASVLTLRFLGEEGWRAVPKRSSVGVIDPNRWNGKLLSRHSTRVCFHRAANPRRIRNAPAMTTRITKLCSA